MKNILYIIAFLLPLSLFSQEERVFVITDSTLADKWAILAKDWLYKKGDQKQWANPEFNDTSWKVKSGSANLNTSDDKTIADRGEIVWLRKRIKADISLNDVLVLNIFQRGVSEIYLDGKLIHQLGSVSPDKDKVIYNNPFRKLLQLPLEKGKVHVLAVRFVNVQYQFPIYSDTNGYFRIAASTLSNANSTDVVKNNYIASRTEFQNRYHISLGLAILIFLIFFCVYLFFPTEKINGYFSLSNLFLVLFTAGVIWVIKDSGPGFWISFYYDTCIVISGMIVLYCLYHIFEKTVDAVFKAVFLLGLIAIGCFFLFDPDLVAPTWGLILYLATIKLGIKSLNNKRVAGIIFITSSFTGLLFWFYINVNRIWLTQLPSIEQYIPFLFMLNPIVLGIYLAYSFGKNSQDLRLNLEQVQKLSSEKESILSQQKDTLEQQVKKRTSDLNRTLNNLKATQNQLVQSEKMASLGELTAGIAHEIQNPLNFVNNFSEVNSELIEEMKEELEKGNLDEVKVIAKDIDYNEQKIMLHGKRADAIVKGMLQHSRSSDGKKEFTNINALADEFFRLAYHGLRAKDKTFNATLKTDFDNSIGKVNLAAQDIGRVILNLITNAFYVVDEKKKSGIENYEPTVLVTTKKMHDSIEVSVKDNGNGIPQNDLDKIFQPFFTTKPTGKGTGLGLSLSYDIVKAHGGELKVESSEGEGAEFIIILPI